MLNTIEIKRLEGLWYQAAEAGVFHVTDFLEAMLIVHGVEFNIAYEPYPINSRIDIKYPGGTDDVKP